MTIGILTIVVFLPAAGALMLLFMPRRQETLLRGVALAVASLAFLASALLIASAWTGSAFGW